MSTSLLVANPQWFPPLWAQIIVYVSVFLVASRFIWSHALRPLVRLVTAAEEMLPVLQNLTAEFQDAPQAFKVLRSISSQFQADSGSSLRDVVNRIEECAKSAMAAAEVLRINVETAKLLSEQDRSQIARLVALLDKVSAKVDLNEEGTARLEEKGKVVAANLADAHARAERKEGGEPGEAADAASVRHPKAR